MKRKVISVLLILSIVFSLTTIPPLVTWATDYSADEGIYAYSVSANQVTITGFTPNAELTECEVDIPERIDGMLVVGIGNSAFYNKPTIVSINMPDSITSIGNEAFYRCSKLSSLHLSSGLTSIGYRILRDCPLLTTVNIPAGITSVYCGKSSYNSYFFSGCGVYQHYDTPFQYSSITSVTFDEGITDIPANLFLDCTTLKSVVFPDTLKTIGDYAFDRCTGLTDVYFNEGLTTIGALAFENCTALTKAELPFTLTYLGYYAFYRCTSLKEVKLGDSLTNIGCGAFCYTAIEEITIPASVTTIENDSYSSKYDYGIFGSSSLKKITFAEGTVTIPSKIAAGATQLKEVSAPETVEEIGSYAFYRTALTETVSPETVKSIGAYAYARDDFAEITNDDIKSITEIGDHVFWHNQLLVKVEIPGTVTTIGSFAFAECNIMTDITISEGVTSIGGSAFNQCSKLNNVTIPDSVTSIGGSAFKQCYSLDTITLVDEVWLNETTEKSIGSYAFSECNALESIEIPDSYTVIGTYAFSKCTALKDVKLSGKMSSISDYTFEYCSALVNIEIPESVTGIGIGAFRYCSALASLELPAKLTSLGQYFIQGTPITTIKIPATLTSGGAVASTCGLGNWAYSFNCKSTGAFAGSSLKTLTFENGITYIPDGLCADCTSLETVIFPDTATTIGDSVFHRCYNLKNVEFNVGMTTIGHMAFKNCSSLVDIDMPYTVTEVGTYAFFSCSSLKNVKLSENLITLNGGAFAFTSLNEITIPRTITNINDTYYYWSPFDDGSVQTITLEEGIKNIPEALFNSAEYIGKVIVPESATNIGYYRYSGVVEIVCNSKNITSIKTGNFEYCKRLKSVNIPEGVVSIGASAFNGCTSLQSITIPSTTTYIGASAFNNCTSLTDVTVLGNVSDILYNTFYQCSALTNVTVSGNVNTIGNYAFYRCYALSNLTLPDSVKSIGNYAFEGCKFASLDLPDSLTAIGDYAFQSCTLLAEIDIPDNVTSINQYAFNNCTSLERVGLPAKLSSIGQYAFYNCAIKELSFPSTLRSLGAHCFHNCNKLEKVTFKDYSITSIPEYAFAACPNITSVTFPYGLTTISSYAFMNNTKLFNVKIPLSVTSIGTNVFSYAANTTIVGVSGSYAQTYADDGGFTFVSSEIPIQGMTLADDAQSIDIRVGQTKSIELEVFPAESTDIITVTSDNSNVSVAQMDIIGRTAGTSTLTAKASNGVTYTFPVNIIGSTGLTVTLNKITYEINDTITPEDITAVVTYSNGTTEEISNYSISGFATTAEGTFNLTVSWTDPYSNTAYKQTLAYNVSDNRPVLESISVATKPLQLIYARRDSLNLQGMRVVGKYSDGSEKEITDYKASGYNALLLGEQEITVTYGSFSDSFNITVVEAHIHTYSEPTVWNADCVNGGGYLVYCTECGALVIEEYYEPLGHKFDTQVFEADCTNGGYTIFTCSVCQYSYEGAYVAPLGHRPFKQVTCTEDAVCSVCGVVSAKALGHSFTTETFEPTCEKNGYINEFCVNCGLMHSTQLNALGHQFGQWVEVTPATETTNGLRQRVCAVCGKGEKMIIQSMETRTLIAVQSQNAVKGEKLHIPINIQNYAGLTNIRFCVKYDSRYFTLTKVIDGGLCGSNVSYVDNGSYCTFVWDNDTATTDYTGSGVLTTLVFQVDYDTPADSYKFEIFNDYPNDFMNAQMQAVEVLLCDGSVSVDGYKFGDLNKDGVLDAADRTILTRALAGWEGYESYLYSPVADINKDGSVTLRDRLILSRYLAGWDGYDEYFVGVV